MGKRLRHDSVFIADERRHGAKYYIQWIVLFFMDVFFKVVFTFVRKRPREDAKYYLVACGIFKNEAPYLKEWIEYNLLVGFDHFYLYNNNSEDDYLSVLQPYIDRGIVTLTEWPEVPGQIGAYRHWYDHYREEAAWCSFLDMDEYPCPLRDDDMKAWLRRRGKYPQYAVYWRVFGTGGQIDADPERLVCEQYTTAWPRFHRATKVVWNTRYDISRFYKSMMHRFNVRFLGMNVPAVNQYGFFVNSWDIHRHGLFPKTDIQINHYWSKSYREFHAKHGRGDACQQGGRSLRNRDMFLWHEHKCTVCDRSAYRFLLQLKLRMRGESL